MLIYLDGKANSGCSRLTELRRCRMLLQYLDHRPCSPYKQNNVIILPTSSILSRKFGLVSQLQVLLKSVEDFVRPNSQLDSMLGSVTQTFDSDVLHYRDQLYSELHNIAAVLLSKVSAYVMEDLNFLLLNVSKQLKSMDADTLVQFSTSLCLALAVPNQDYSQLLPLLLEFKEGAESVRNKAAEETISALSEDQDAFSTFVTGLSKLFYVKVEEIVSDAENIIRLKTEIDNVLPAKMILFKRLIQLGANIEKTAAKLKVDTLELLSKSLLDIFKDMKTANTTVTLYDVDRIKDLITSYKTACNSFFKLPTDCSLANCKLFVELLYTTADCLWAMKDALENLMSHVHQAAPQKSEGELYSYLRHLRNAAAHSRCTRQELSVAVHDVDDEGNQVFYHSTSLKSYEEQCKKFYEDGVGMLGFEVNLNPLGEFVIVRRMCSFEAVPCFSQCQPLTAFCEKHQRCRICGDTLNPAGSSRVYCPLHIMCREPSCKSTPAFKSGFCWDHRFYCCVPLCNKRSKKENSSCSYHKCVVVCSFCKLHVSGKDALQLTPKLEPVKYCCSVCMASIKKYPNRSDEESAFTVCLQEGCFVRISTGRYCRNHQLNCEHPGCENGVKLGYLKCIDHKDANVKSEPSGKKKKK